MAKNQPCIFEHCRNQSGLRAEQSEHVFFPFILGCLQHDVQLESCPSPMSLGSARCCYSCGHGSCEDSGGATGEEAGWCCHLPRRGSLHAFDTRGGQSSMHGNLVMFIDANRMMCARRMPKGASLLMAGGDSIVYKSWSIPHSSSQADWQIGLQVHRHTHTHSHTYLPFHTFNFSSAPSARYNSTHPNIIEYPSW